MTLPLSEYKEPCAVTMPPALISRLFTASSEPESSAAPLIVAVRLLDALSSAPWLLTMLPALILRSASSRVKLPLPSAASYSSPAIIFPLLVNLPSASIFMLPRAEILVLFSISALKASKLMLPLELIIHYLLLTLLRHLFLSQ